MGCPEHSNVELHVMHVCGVLIMWPEFSGLCPCLSPKVILQIVVKDHQVHICTFMAQNDAYSIVMLIAL